MKKIKGLTPSDKFNFGGGLVTMVAKTRLAPNQLIEAKNVNINIDGEFEVRGGCSKVSTVAFGTEIDRFIHFKTNTYDKIIAYGGAYVKRLDTGTPDVWTQLDGSMSDTQDYRSMAIAMDKLYIGANDTTGPRKYVGGQSALWKAGIVAPTTKPSTAEGAAGNPSGTYTHYYTYYNSVTEEESDPSPISDSLVVSNKQITVSGFVASTDPQVNKINIYRNPHGVSAWYYVGQKNNDTNNFTDNVADANLGIELSIRNAPPPKSAVMLWHLNRMYYVDDDNPSRIYISEPFKPGSVYSESYLDIEVGDGGEIVRLISCYDNIIALKNTGVYCIELDKAYPEESDYIILSADYGCIAPMSAENIGEDVIFLSPEGLKFISNAGTTLKEIGVMLPTEGGKYIDPIANIFKDCHQSVISKAVGTYYEHRDQYSISVPYYSDANNDLTLVWYKPLGIFMTHEGFYVKAANLYREYDNKLLYRSHNDQYIYRHDTGYADDGTAISFDVQTGWHDLNEIPDNKKIRVVFPTIYGSDGISISYEILKGFESGGWIKTVSHQGASYWGYAHWGQNYWGASGEVIYRHKCRIRGRIFSVRFYGSVSTGKIGVVEYQVFYKPESL